MTDDDYYGVVTRVFGLKGTAIPTMFMTAEGEPQRVPLAKGQTPEQKRDTLARIAMMLGKDWKDGD